jgi:hypothetical protein
MKSKPKINPKWTISIRRDGSEKTIVKCVVYRPLMIYIKGKA